MGILSSLASSVTSNLPLIGEVVGGAMASHQAKDASRRQYAFNKALAQYQNEWNLEQWHRENAYNDPSAQMARLLNAGLNPNLVYNNGATTLAANSSSASPSGVGLDNRAAIMQATGQGVSQGILAQSQLQYNKAQIQKANAEALKTLADSKISETTAKYADTVANLQINGMIQDMAKSQSEQAFVDQQTLAQQITNKYLKKQIIRQLKYTDAQTVESIARTASLRAGIRLSNAQISNLTQLTRNAQQEFLKLLVETDNARKQGAILDHEELTARSNSIIAKYKARTEELLAPILSGYQAQKYDLSTGIGGAQLFFDIVGSLFGGAGAAAIHNMK